MDRFDSMELRRALAMEREVDELLSAEYDVAAAIATLGQITTLKQAFGGAR